MPRHRSRAGLVRDPHAGVALRCPGQCRTARPGPGATRRVRGAAGRLRGLPQPARGGAVYRRAEDGHPLGAIYATNITADGATGIGAYSLADFDRAVRHG
ncbi:hypothetical protein NWF32_28270 [Pseudomonas qingdaonensis]|nr:hypothetical protein [Pseudomonas qingdaonensis]